MRLTITRSGGSTSSVGTPKTSFLGRVNLARSMGAYGAFLTGLVVYVCHAPELIRPDAGYLMLGGFLAWAVGLPIRSELNRRSLIAAGQVNANTRNEDPAATHEPRSEDNGLDDI